MADDRISAEEMQILVARAAALSRSLRSRSVLKDAQLQLSSMAPAKAPKEPARAPKEPAKAVELDATAQAFKDAHGVTADAIPAIVDQLKAHGMVALGERREITPDVCRAVLEAAL